MLLLKNTSRDLSISVIYMGWLRTFQFALRCPTEGQIIFLLKKIIFVFYRFFHLYVYNKEYRISVSVYNFQYMLRIHLLSWYYHGFETHALIMCKPKVQGPAKLLSPFVILQYSSYQVSHVILIQQAETQFSVWRLYNKPLDQAMSLPWRP